MSNMMAKAIEESRTPANSESVDDALKLLQDAHQKFRYYEGHQLRCVNSRDAFSKMEEDQIKWVEKNKRCSS